MFLVNSKLSLVSKLIMGLFSGLLIMLSQASYGAAEVKIGYVDMQKAIQSTSLGKKAKETLEAEFNKKKKELEKKEADLKKMNEDFEKKKLVLSDEIRDKKANEIRSEMMKYQEMVGKSQLEIQKKERDLTFPIVKKLKETLEKIAKDEKYTMILEKSEQSVLFAVKEVDLTERLISDFEKSK